MARLKTFLKYILWLVGFSLFTYALIFVGLNATYKNMENEEDIPDGVTISMAQSTKVNGRIYGEVTSTEENDLNDKYLKVDIFDRKNNLVGTKFLKLENLSNNEPKKFMVNYTAENIKNYKIDIVEETKEIDQKILDSKRLYKDIFTDDELKGGMIVALVLALSFGL